MTAWLIAQVAPYLIGLMALFGVTWRVVADIKASERQKIKLDDAAEYQRTIKEMGRVEIDDSADDAQCWLRERGKP